MLITPLDVIVYISIYLFSVLFVVIVESKRLNGNLNFSSAIWIIGAIFIPIILPLVYLASVLINQRSKGDLA